MTTAMTPETILIEYEHRGKVYIATPDQLVEEATYANYRFNRRNNPSVTVEAWGKMFQDVEALEQRYVGQP